MGCGKVRQGKASNSKLFYMTRIQFPTMTRIIKYAMAMADPGFLIPP